MTANVRARLATEPGGLGEERDRRVGAEQSGAERRPTHDVVQALGEPYSGFHQLWRWVLRVIRR